MDTAALQTLLVKELEVDKLYLAGNGWFRGCCPLHPERNPSFGVDSAHPRHIYKCFFCGTGTLASLVMTVKNLSYREALRLITRYGEYSVDDVNKMAFPAYSERHAFKQAPEIGVYMLASYTGKELMKSANFLKLPPPLLEKTGVGYDAKNNRIIFPWWFDGKLVGVTGRFRGKLPADTPKTLPYFGTQKGDWLYCPRRRFKKNEAVYLAEGEKDALSTFRVFANAVATGSASFTVTQAKILIDNGAPVIVMKDPDAGGEKFLESVFSKLHKHLPLAVAEHPYLDAGAQQPSVLLSTVLNRTYITAV